MSSLEGHFVFHSTVCYAPFIPYGVMCVAKIIKMEERATKVCIRYYLSGSVSILRYQTFSSGSPAYFLFRRSKLHAVDAKRCHCICLFRMTDTRVVVGEHDVSEDDTENIYRKYYNITHYFIAPGYWNNNTVKVNDIALLRLERKISISQNVRPICAPDTEQLYAYWRCVMAGWGNIESKTQIFSASVFALFEWSRSNV